MILTDAGPLVALIDAGEPDHATCAASLANFPSPMVTTWPAYTEAMYLLGAAAGWSAQAALWELIDRGALELHPATPLATRRMRVLMQKYADLPMDLADASLVALAEALGVRDIFTLDRRDFTTYRIAGQKTFRVWPA